MRKLKEYFNRPYYVPMWTVWMINIYVGILILKLSLALLLKVLKWFL